MQGSVGLLNTVTIPPGAGINSPRLVMDGVRGAFFLYGPGGSFIGSWASQAGTDPYGNQYPQGFLGEHGTISGTDFLVYAGTPALGSLIGSWSGTGGVDIYGNAYPQGFMAQTDQAGTVSSIWSIMDGQGNILASVDTAGNITGTVGNFDDINLGGQSLLTQILPQYPLGIVARGYVVSSSNWPGTAIGTSETAILELDCTVPANRQYELRVLPCTIIPTMSQNVQLIHRVKYTTDGSTPTTASAQLANWSPQVAGIPSALTGLNVPIELLNWLVPFNTVDTFYRFLLTASISAGSFLYVVPNMRLEMQLIDWGNDAVPNTGVQLGSGTSGGSATSNYTKTYYPTESHSYFGATATYGSGPYGKRNDNGTMWQGCPSGGAFHEGDQYSFFRFNYSQIASDIGSGTINWVKLRLNDLTTGQSGGVNIICGYSTYTGTYGDPFQPGAGTHMNQEAWKVSPGSNIQRTLGSWAATAIKSGGFTSFVLGTSASRTNGTDLSNFGSFYGATPGNPNNATPQLQINYNK